ncbi:MAG TPA: hypothetical protein ENK44_06610 [Caldithrix abyssi]|uniref:Mannitol dehydrogenase C-terminal domain-containing protein n=1 Tax=Caldithrix abyssi TaxID=187145 RepID=A0A7V4WVG8_CALAY|nr:hypothetical protein [Caldithrix abyssi]
MNRKKTFFGFGLGAIQSGLMLLEATKSGNFDRLVIAEINEKLVSEVRHEGNSIIVNIATDSKIEKFHIKNIEVYNPLNAEDVKKIKAAIRCADEMATAVPSIDFYTKGENSIVSLLAENINPARQQILYAAENNNYAAEILYKQIQQIAGSEKLVNFQPLNTVIGKMSGIIQNKETIERLDLSTITRESSYAVLVEAFNSIIVSKITLPGFTRGIDVFVEKENLLPFEEAKLFGHNAVHSMLGFLADMKSYNYMDEIKNDQMLWAYGETAFKKESGAFLVKKYQHLGDSLFTERGFAAYGEDLLQRMTNPFLRDEVQRICRDPLRKLGYGDRLIGTIREALKQKVQANTIAKGVLGGICFLIKNRQEKGIPLPEDISCLSKNRVRDILISIWEKAEDDGLKDMVLSLIMAQYDEFMEQFHFAGKGSG